MMNELIREGIEDEIERSVGVEVKVACSSSIVASASSFLLRSRQTQLTNQVLNLIPHAPSPVHPLLLRLPTLRIHDRMRRPHVAQQLDGELGKAFGFLTEEVELLLLVAARWAEPRSAEKGGEGRGEERTN